MEGVVGTIIVGLVLGIIIGPLARLVVPGRQSIGIFMTIVIGAIGGIGGGLLYGAFGGTDTSGIDWIKLFVQVGVAAVLVILVSSMSKGRAT